MSIIIYGGDTNLTYVIYVDWLILKDFIFNMLFLFSLEFITKERIKLSRKLIISILMAAVDLVITLLTINTSSQYYVFSLYIIINVLMLKIAYPKKKLRALIISMLFIFIIEALFFSLYTMISNRIHFKYKEIISMFIAFFFSLIIIYYFCKTNRNHDIEHTVTIILENTLKQKEYKYSAITDTGNLVKLPYTKKPCIIADGEVLNEIFTYEIIEVFLKNGHFDYISMSNIGYYFFPISVNTYDNHTNSLPCFIFDKIIIDDTRIYHKVPICFTNNIFSNTHKLLLPDDIS